ncbi:MAG: hypothetical protein KC983_08810, partial [Phycisphaerales bacterium]|nr:hypothetical protein [Phycisphaerales bacterium]
MKRHGMGFLCAASVTLACTTGAGADAPAPGMRSHNSKIKTTDSMMDTAGSMMVGACCFPSTACLDITESECMSQGGEFRAGLSCVKPALGAPGIYALRNHPDNHLTPPEYGMRLDELFDVNPATLDVFSFDFEADGAAMFLEYDGSSIHIFGTAFGGLDIGNVYDPAFSSFVEIDFTYSDVQVVPGDDDLYVVTPSGSDSGTVTWLDTNEVFNIVSQSIPAGFTFRFGNEDDDLGHRGFDGLSGWGWVRLPNPTHLLVVQDWLFTAVGTCPDFPTGACCLDNGTCVIATEMDCIDEGGVYQGSGTTCANVSCPQPGGACCLEDGFCVDATQQACDMAGGLFQGDFTACMIIECPQPIGACCLPTGLCVEATEDDCLVQGGVYQG